MTHLDEWVHAEVEPPGVLHVNYDHAAVRQAPQVSIEVVRPGSKRVLLNVLHDDYLGGLRDVREMRIYGDVEPWFHPRIQQAQADAGWMPFRYQTPIVIKGALGVVRTIYVDVRTASGRVLTSSVAFTVTDPGHAEVLILRGPPARPAHNETISFRWCCSHAFTEWKVMLAPTLDAAMTACHAIGTANGSTNITGSGAFTPDTTTETSVAVNDLIAAQVAAKMDGITVVSAAIFKVFCLTTVYGWTG